MTQPFNPNQVLPVGAQVVTRVEISGRDVEPPRPPGAVGVIVEAPRDNSHSYHIPFSIASHHPPPS